MTDSTPNFDGARERLAQVKLRREQFEEHRTPGARENWIAAIRHSQKDVAGLLAWIDKASPDKPQPTLQEHVTCASHGCEERNAIPFVEGQQHWFCEEHYYTPIGPITMQCNHKGCNRTTVFQNEEDPGDIWVPDFWWCFEHVSEMPKEPTDGTHAAEVPE